MTLRERVRKMVVTANGSTTVMEDEVADRVMPVVLSLLNEKANSLGHDGFDFDREADEYPEVMYLALWIYVKPCVFDFLEREYPNFPHRSCYMTSERRKNPFNLE